MKPPVVLLLVLGIILGPVYYGYCLHLSGTTAQTYSLVERAERWVTPDGAILRFRGGLGYKPQPIELAPQMNQVKLRLQFSLDAAAAADAVRGHYQASLLEQDHPVFERAIDVEVRPGRTYSYEIGPVEIAYAARYLFLLEEVGAPAATPAVTLVLIEKVDKPNKPVVWTGLGLLVIAFMIQLHALWTARRRPHEP